MAEPRIGPEDLLAYVLREGRLLLGEKEEQVGETLNMSGRTVRRLEAAEVRRPRAVTLEALADYYALGPEFLKWLVSAPREPEALRTELEAWAADLDVDLAVDDRRLALRIARAGDRPRGRRGVGAADELASAILALDTRRLALVRSLVDELLLAQSEELRRRAEG